MTVILWEWLKPAFPILNPEIAFKYAIKCYITTNNTHLQYANIVHPEGESMKMGFDGSIKLEFHGTKVT